MRLPRWVIFSKGVQTCQMAVPRNWWYHIRDIIKMSRTDILDLPHVSAPTQGAWFGNQVKRCWWQPRFSERTITPGTREKLFLLLTLAHSVFPTAAIECSFALTYCCNTVLLWPASRIQTLQLYYSTSTWFAIVLKSVFLIQFRAWKDGLLGQSASLLARGDIKCEVILEIVWMSLRY